MENQPKQFIPPQVGLNACDLKALIATTRQQLMENHVIPMGVTTSAATVEADKDDWQVLGQALAAVYHAINTQNSELELDHLNAMEAILLKHSVIVSYDSYTHVARPVTEIACPTTEITEVANPVAEVAIACPTTEITSPSVEVESVVTPVTLVDDLDRSTEAPQGPIPGLFSSSHVDASDNTPCN